MSDETPQDDKPRKTRWGKKPSVRMTPETHPEIMELYTSACEKDNLEPRPIYMVEADPKKSRAQVNHLLPNICITKKYLEESSNGIVFFTLMHERRHLSKEQNIKMALLTGAYMAPLLAASIEMLHVIGPGHPSEGYLVDLAAGAVAYVMSRAVVARNLEEDSDRYAAVTVGPEITREVADEWEKKKDTGWRLDHPSDKHRIAVLRSIATEQENKGRG